MQEVSKASILNLCDKLLTADKRQGVVHGMTDIELSSISVCSLLPSKQQITIKILLCISHCLGWFYAIFISHFSYGSKTAADFWQFPLGNSVAKNCKFCLRDLQILRAIFANCAQILCNISTCFCYGTIVCDTGVLSRVSWLVGPLKLRITIQLHLVLDCW